jgi:hypothetical protein
MKRVTTKESESTGELTDLIRQACLVAKDSAFNGREFVRESSKMAFSRGQGLRDRAEQPK